jgi:alkane 1-monooxygenase
LFVPIQYAIIFLTLNKLNQPGLTWVEITGMIAAAGLACGVFGINIAHELGHRSTPHERAMAKALLLTSLYTHFYIEHNKGHHRWVATEKDPASSRYGETLYAFWFRSMIGGYLSAWHIENTRLRKEGKALWSPIHNEMVRFTLMQIAFVAAIGLIFSPVVMGYFLIMALIGGLLLETVNYIEHYGLQRKKLGEDRYERTMPVHSWNSNHILGRLMLFELSRHSDHHYKPARKYQVLRHHDDAPQMPTGYPGMMLLSTIPPLWFYVMHRRIAHYRKELKSGAAMA